VGTPPEGEIQYKALKWLFFSTLIPGVCIKHSMVFFSTQIPKVWKSPPTNQKAAEALRKLHNALKAVPRKICTNWMLTREESSRIDLRLQNL
jgi:hypothetical protein